MQPARNHQSTTIRTFLVTLIPALGPGRPIRACNAYHAVAEAADCALNDVCIPIWERRNHWRDQFVGTPPIEQCYMPRDGSGRQWLVQEQPESEEHDGFAGLNAWADERAARRAADARRAAESKERRLGFWKRA